MKYYEIDFLIDAPEALIQDARDLVAAMAGEAGLETFEETDQGLKGYVQQQLFDSDLLTHCLQQYQLPGTVTTFTVGEAEDRDWNEEWEQQGFNPIFVDGKCLIHDGRHLPESNSQTSYEASVEIDARLAFGTGNHETTRLMVSALLSLPLRGCRVLDCGCGTGILGIVALRQGASHAIGYDIDEWSVDNARHNAVINHVDDRYASLLGDASILKDVEGTFDVVLANINRNILLADLPVMRQKMGPNAHLLLSGFYAEDAQLLIERATQLGLHLVRKSHEGQWNCLLFSATKGE
jgi:ribosomal protein L11 methyltransferase